MYKEGDSCPICIKGKLSEKIITEKFNYKGKKISIPNYHIYNCDVCSEEFVNPKTLKDTEKSLTDYRRKVDGLLTSSEIKAIRDKLGKTQTQLAEYLGVGQKNFARYENGQVTQNKSMDLLLRILDSDPNILNKISKQIEFNYEVIDKPSIPCCDMNGLKYKSKPSIYECANTELRYAA